MMPDTSFATQKTMQSTVNSQPAVSVVLGAEFCDELQANVKAFNGAQENADNSKWVTAKLVNDMWDESKKHFDDKKQYYAECSRVANIGLKKKPFSDSGETLRRWCEVQSFYGAFSFGDKVLDVYTFAHLVEIKRLVSRGVTNPATQSPLTVVEALHETAVNKWTSEEVREHYDPAQKPLPYELVQGRLAGLMNVGDYPFLKSKEARDECAKLASQINKIIRDELEKEGKAV